MTLFIALILGIGSLIGCQKSSPVKQKDPVTSERKKVVIFLPGILGTELYSPEGNSYWPPKIWQVFSFDKSLALDETGKSLHKVVTGNPIDEFYGKVAREFKRKGYDFHTLGYDFRLDNRESAAKLREKIESLHADKVDIIAHSMGGIVASYYLKEFGTKNVKRLITLGTPFLGAPGVLKTISFGDTVSTPLVGKNLNAKFAGLYRNFPSWYQLFPTRHFFSKTGDFYLTLNGKNLSYDESISFLAKLSHVLPGLVKDAVNFHQDLNLESVLAKVESHAVVGFGFETIDQLEVQVAQNQLISSLKNRITKNGDGGVLLHSATLGGRLSILCRIGCTTLTSTIRAC